MSYIPEYCNEAAFPRPATPSVTDPSSILIPEQWGLTKREYIVISVLSVMCQSFTDSAYGAAEMDRLADIAMKLADALLRRLPDKLRSSQMTDEELLPIAEKYARDHTDPYYTFDSEGILGMLREVLATRS